MEATVRYLGGVRFEASARGHHLTSDQPPDNGGSDTGMTPPELMLASLGTCAGFYATQYLGTRSLPSEKLEIRVVAEKALQPARLANLRLEISLPGLDKRHEEGVLRAVRSCLIHNTLLHSPRIETVVNSPALTIA
jgi:uncharacterized OsmC-like protein